jgi:hypothetical protein
VGELWTKMNLICDKLVEDMKIIEKEERDQVPKERMITKMLFID